MALFWLSDEAWAAIEPHLPKNQPGARRVDDRRVISGIMYVLKVGCRWWECQEFRVRAGIKGKKETRYVPTQRACDTERAA